MTSSWPARGYFVIFMDEHIEESMLVSCLFLSRFEQNAGYDLGCALDAV